MWPLAFKDILCVRREKSIFVVVLISLAMPLAFMRSGSAIGVFLAILPAYYVSGWACALDFKYRGDRFLCSLPVSSARLAAYRYASAIAAWALTFAISLPMWILLAAAGSGLPLSRLLYVALLSLSLTLVAHAVYFGAYYVLGYQNARWAIFFIFAAMGALGSALSSVLGPPSAIAAGAMDGEGLLASIIAGDLSRGAYAGIVGASLALYALSYLVSVAAYRRKDF